MSNCLILFIKLFLDVNIFYFILNYSVLGYINSTGYKYFLRREVMR